MRAHAITLVLVAAVCAASFGGALRNPFLWDDNLIIIANPGVHDVGRPLKFFTPEYWKGIRADYRAMPQRGYRPIPELTFALDYAVWGANPVGYHAVNIAVHTLNCMLLYVLALSILKDDRAATFCALLFAAHPIHVEAVVWVKARSELLALLFVLTSMIAYGRSLNSTGLATRRYLHLCSIAAYAFALMCKASAAVLPAPLAIYVWCFLPRGRRRAGYFGLIPFVGVVAVFFAMKAALPFVPNSPQVAEGSRVLTGFSALGIYLKLLVVPVGLCAHHLVETVWRVSDPPLLRMIPMAAAVLAAAVLALRRSKVAFFALGWLIVGLAPLSVLELMGRRVGELRAYSPSLGFCLLAALLLSRLPSLVSPRISRLSLERAAIALCLLLVATYTGLSAMRTLDWRDPFTFWADTRAKNPRSWHAAAALADVYAKRGMFREAIEHQEYLADTIPEDRHARYRLAVLYQGAGRFDDAMRLYEVLAAEDPTDARARAALAGIHARRGEHDEAISLFRQAVELAPRSAYVRRQLGAYHSRMGRYDEALAQLEESYRIQPLNSVTLEMLGATYTAMGRHSDAISMYRRCLETAPTRLAVWLSMGDSYEKLGDIPEAARCYQEAMAAGGPVAQDAQQRLAALAQRYRR